MNTIHVKSTPYTTRNMNNILLSAKHNFFKKGKGEDIFIKEENIFPFTDWSKFDPFPQVVVRLSILKDFSVYNCHNPKGVKIVARVRLDVSRLQEDKFRYSFQVLTSN